MWLLVSDDKDEFDQFILAASEHRTADRASVMWNAGTGPVSYGRSESTQA